MMTGGSTYWWRPNSTTCRRQNWFGETDISATTKVQIQVSRQSLQGGESGSGARRDVAESQISPIGSDRRSWKKKPLVGGGRGVEPVDHRRRGEAAVHHGGRVARGGTGRGAAAAAARQTPGASPPMTPVEDAGENRRGAAAAAARQTPRVSPPTTPVEDGGESRHAPGDAPRGADLSFWPYARLKPTITS